jgi:hypothetical protein
MIYRSFAAREKKWQSALSVQQSTLSNQPDCGSFG